ncbi:hypothetical protein MRB53_040695 [Persea americana]|nr:hypothetical protein MRB53_040695 [Persea americana]
MLSLRFRIRLLTRSGIALKAASVLGFDRLTDSGASGLPGDVLERENEIKRRCFWAAWLSCSINSDHHQGIGTFFHERVRQLPLPIGDEAFESGQSVELVSIATRAKKYEVNSGCQAPPSIMAELMSLVMIWQVSL